jgi:hypothetical protein
MTESLDICPRCKHPHIFFAGADKEYKVGDMEYCPKCGLEIFIDWDGNEDSIDMERCIFWYT